MRIVDKKDCCGCGACVNACPSHSLTMAEDAEGFLYPETDDSTCTECGLCGKCCPVLHAKADIPFAQDGYLARIKDLQIRKESTSGGVFTAIAQSVIRAGGIVYGAAYDRDFRVCHSAAFTDQELYRFRGSKYVQSDTKETFREVKEYLRDGKLVCYSGTPCQIEGLKRYLKEEPAHLITVDFVCHGVPSPLIWRKYLEMQMEKYPDSHITDILFRNKGKFGYQYSVMTIKSGRKELYARGTETDPMLRAFFSDICDRPSCYACKFKKRYRMSDITIWDCFDVRKFQVPWDDHTGASQMLVHTDKGRTVFRSIEERVESVFIEPDRLTEDTWPMFESVKAKSAREDFFRDAASMCGFELFHKYYPQNLSVKMARYGRVICYKTGIYGFVRRMYHRYFKQRK